MITRIRIEAEGSTPQAVMQQLEVAHECLISQSHERTLNLLFGEPGSGGVQSSQARPGLTDAQAGECVIERYAREVPDNDRAGDGAVVYKGRMTAHYARPQKLRKLTGHSDLPSGLPHADSVDGVRWTHCPGCGVELAPGDPTDLPVKAEHKPGCKLGHSSERVEVSPAEAAMRVAGGEEHTVVGGGGRYEVTSTQGREEPVDRVPALGQESDAPLTRERLIATWNENVPPVQRPNAQPLRLCTGPGDTFVRAMQLWQTDDQLQVLYDQPMVHPNLGAKYWMAYPQAGAGG